MKGRVLIILCIVLVCISVYGCTKALTKEIEEAKQFINIAQKAGADKYAPEDIKVAQNALSSAEAKVKEKKYKEAREFVLTAKTKAEVAKVASEAESAKIREVERLIDEADTALTESRKARQHTYEYNVVAVRWAKKKGYQLNPLKLDNKLKLAEEALTSAKNSLKTGDYLAAKDWAGKTRTQADEVKDEIKTYESKKNHVQRVQEEKITNSLIKQLKQQPSAETTDPSIRPYIGKTVYLWYDGLISTVQIWSKPGAAAFGASIIKTLSLSGGRIPCRLLSHEALDSERNYFLVRLRDGTEGWVGRPYVFKSETGYGHILPNPITGEP